MSYDDPIQISFLALPTPPTNPKKLYLVKTPGIIAQQLKGGYSIPESLTEEERSQPSPEETEETETESERTTETSRGPIQRSSKRRRGF